MFTTQVGQSPAEHQYYALYREDDDAARKCACKRDFDWRSMATTGTKNVRNVIESYNPQCTVRNCFVCVRQ